MSTGALRPSRRGVLAAGLGATAVLVGGCGESDSAGTAPAGAPAAGEDSDLVADVGGLIADTLGLATATAAAHAGLRDLGRRLAAVHRAHLRELGRDGAGTRRRASGTAERARERLLGAEANLQRRLVAAALAAESGALAQVFAAMAAALAQQRAVSG